MPHNLDLILTLTSGLGAALAFGYLSQRLRLSPIVGYLLAGVIIGPFTPGFIAHPEIAEQLAEVGVILLMFGVGLHFHVKELTAVRRIAIPGAVVQIAIATLLGVLLTHLFGWTLVQGLVFGLAISVASTVVLLRLLGDHHALHTPAGHIAVGWLLVEDLFTVLVLVMLPILVVQEAGATGAILSIGLALLKIGALIAFTLFFGQRAIPLILNQVAKLRSRELFTLTVLVIALGIAVGAAKLFGASMALGAFLAGMVVGQSEFSTRAASEALPMRDAFAVLFFVSMGMLLDPTQLTSNLGLVAGTLAIILLGKPIAALFVVWALRYPPKIAATVAVSLAQIGEFSFMLAALGRQLHVLPDSATQALVVASIVSIMLNPVFYRLVEPLARILPSRARDTGEPLHVPIVEPEQRTIVVGYGPIGRMVTTLLRENNLVPTVIELNHETVKKLNLEGIHAVYGDASQSEVLEHAGIRNSASLIFAASGSPDAVVRQAHAINPDILILTRTTYLGEIPSLRRAGAQFIVTAEAEVAFAMTAHILKTFGATSDQLDRARDWVRAEVGA
ncbi:MAG: sodium:proton exchanger [Polyangiaceae bacterium]|nr:sodium:proton exchanger [Polyangiaceae bacterium]